VDFQKGTILTALLMYIGGYQVMVMRVMMMIVMMIVMLIVMVVVNSAGWSGYDG
jgi:hypothetical protein